MAVGTVLLTGASGLLGTWLRRTAPAGSTVVPLLHRTRLADGRGVVADLRDGRAAAAAVTRVRPALVVHAAYAHDEDSIVHATQHVVDAAGAVGAGLVHVSSDAVFSGDGTARAEDDPPDATWAYGVWKARAEQVVARASASSAILRLPLIVSLDPQDHVVAAIRRGAAEGQPTRWFDDELRQPARAQDLAAALWAIAALDAGARGGTWHLPGPERLTRYQIARRIVSAHGLGSDTVTAERTPASGARPRDLHLLDERARRTIGWEPGRVLADGPDPATGGRERGLSPGS